MWRALFLIISCVMWGCGHSPAPPTASMTPPSLKPPELVTHRINPRQLEVYRPGKMYVLSGRGHIKDGMREGSWGFEQLDQVVAFGAYGDGKRQGYWSFGPLHAPIAAGYYVDDQPHGLWRFQCIKAGAPLCEAHFERGHQLSWQAQADAKSPRYTLRRLSEGGMWRLTEHDAQGRLRQEVSLALTASPTAWVPHQSASFGTQLYPQSLSSLAAINCHGQERRYGEDGQLLSERACAHGQWHGVSRSFYPDALHQLQQLAEYEHGLAHGPRRLYDANGELVALERWQRGLRHGQWQRWRAGVLVEQLEYERGALVGTSHHFFDDGSPRAVRSWRTGQLHGPAQDWHPNGHLWASRRYVYGRPDGDFALYHPNRQKLVQGQWSYGRPVGRWRGWFEGGQVRFDGGFYDQSEVKRCHILDDKRRILCMRRKLDSLACHLRYNPVTKRFDLPSSSSSYIPCTRIVGKVKPGWRWWDERGRSRALPAPPLRDTPAQRRMAKYQRRCDRHLELPAQALDAKHQAIAARLNHADVSWHKGYLSPGYARCLELSAPLF